MPNWCMNSLMISHDDESVISELVNKLENMEEHAFLQTLDPNYEYRSAQEVDWTKIGANAIEANFDTAWSPPITVYEFLEEAGFEVSASFYEPGMDFAGFYMDGEEDTYTLSDYSNDWFEDDPVGKELDQSWGILDDRMSREDWDEEEIFD